MPHARRLKPPLNPFPTEIASIRRDGNEDEEPPFLPAPYGAYLTQLYAPLTAGKAMRLRACDLAGVTAGAKLVVDQKTVTSHGFRLTIRFLHQSLDHLPHEIRRDIIADDGLADAIEQDPSDGFHPHFLVELDGAHDGIRIGAGGGNR